MNTKTPNYLLKMDEDIIEVSSILPIKQDEFQFIEWNSETNKLEIIFSDETYLEIDVTIKQILEVLNYDCSAEGAKFVEDSFCAKLDGHKQEEFEIPFDEINMDDVDLNEYCVKTGFIKKYEINMMENVFKSIGESFE